MEDQHRIVGRLLRASNRGFTFGCRLAATDDIVFGSLVRAQAQAGQTQVYGLVYEIQVTDDGLVRQLSVADESLLSEPRPDERHHRAAPNEVSVLTAGYRRAGSLPRFCSCPEFCAARIPSAASIRHPADRAPARAHSRTSIFLRRHISLSTFGHTLTVTSPRWAFFRSSICTRDCPMPPPMLKGISSFRII